jgi:small conductance mechanosensitive channel
MQEFDVGTVVNQSIDVLASWGLKVLGAIAVLLIGRMIASWGRKLTRRTLERAGVDETVVPFAARLVYFLIMVFVLLAVLGLFGIPTTSIIAVLGAASLAVGLALQGTLSNFAAGVMLLIFRPFEVDDYIEVAGHAGTAKTIGVFATTLNTIDNVQITIPNGKVYGEAIKNYTANDIRRVDLIASVAYDDDLQTANDTLMGILEADDRVLDDPAPTVAVSELGASSVDFVVRPWCRAEDYWDVRFDLTRRIKESLEEAGCSIPFPQQDMHVIHVPEGLGDRLSAS